jgi:hypothetical protein
MRSCADSRKTFSSFVDVFGANVNNLYRRENSGGSGGKPL